MVTKSAILLGVLCAGTRLLGDDLGADIESALIANAEALSGLTIRGYQERNFLIDPAEGLKELREPGSEKDFTERVPFTVKLKGPKIHWSQRYPKGEYHSGTAVNERSFDGSQIFTGVNDPKGNQFDPGILGIASPQSWIDDDAKLLRDAPVFEVPYLTAAGFTGSVFAKELGRPIRSLVLSEAKIGTVVRVSSVSQEGRRLVEVTVRYPEPWASRTRQSIAPDLNDVPAPMRKRVQFQRDLEQRSQELIGKMRQSTFALDPAMNYAVREVHEWREGEPMMFHTQCNDFVKVNGADLWLPKKCDVISSAYELRPNYVAPRPVYATVLRGDEIIVDDFRDDEFVIWYDHPGTVVQDLTQAKLPDGSPVEYKVPASEDDLNRFVPGGPFSWFIIANLVALIGIAGALVVRRLRRRTTSRER